MSAFDAATLAHLNALAKIEHRRARKRGEALRAAQGLSRPRKPPPKPSKPKPLGPRQRFIIGFLDARTWMPLDTLAGLTGLNITELHRSTRALVARGDLARDRRARLRLKAKTDPNNGVRQ